MSKETEEFVCNECGAFLPMEYHRSGCAKASKEDEEHWVSKEALRWKIQNLEASVESERKRAEASEALLIALQEMLPPTLAALDLSVTALKDPTTRIFDLTRIVRGVMDALQMFATALRDNPPPVMAAINFHPRAWKLMRKQKNFLVVAEDEPYFAQVYDLIRETEQKQDRWTDEDEYHYQVATGKWNP